MSGEDIRTARQARQVLGLGETASVADLRRAFHAAVRRTHPDRGGDPAELRRVIDAHRLLADLHASPLFMTPARVEPAKASAPPQASARTKAKTKAEAPRAAGLALEITIAEALHGGDKVVTLTDGRKGRLKLPAGLRAKDLVRLATPTGEVLFTVYFALGDIEVRGDSLWTTALVSPALLDKGGRLTVAAPDGPRSVWLTPEAGKRGLVRIEGAGLPARGGHEQGHLFIRLKADATAGQGVARDLLRRFTAAWAA